MSQPPDYLRLSGSVNGLPDDFFGDHSESVNDRSRSRLSHGDTMSATDTARKPNDTFIDHEDKVTVPGGYLREMESMIRDLQRRVNVCERGPRSPSSWPASRRGSVTECNDSFMQDERRPRRAFDVEAPTVEPSVIVLPTKSTHSPPPTVVSPPPPPSQGTVALTVDGLPRLEVARWKECATNIGDPEWHVDHESPETAANPKDFSNKSILTVIKEYDVENRFWRRRVKIVSPSVIGLLKDLPHYEFNSNQKDGLRDGGELRLPEPLMVLFNNRKHLQDKASAESRRVREQIQFVLDFMRADFPDVTKRLDDIESPKPSGLVTYEELFLLYAPGTVVYSTENGEHEAFVVDSIRGMQKHHGGKYGRFFLTCWSINYDGEVFGRVWSGHTIMPFHGARKISSLNLVPGRFLPEAEAVKAELIARGQEFWSLQGQNFLEYTGEMWSEHSSDEAVRVIVDQATFQRRNKWPISVDKKRGPDNARSKNWQDKRFSRRDLSGRRGRRRNRRPSISPVPYEREPSPEWEAPRERYTSMYDRYPTDRPAYEDESEFGKYDSMKPWSTPDELTLLLCPQHINGYCLRDKVWKELNISQLRPVNFRKNAWDRLVLDEEYKDIVQAMVSSYVDKTAMLDDLVAGKGAGLVALLHGPPGSGKTLTAECVADSFEKPLYQVTCGDIGTDPEGLEERLEEIFDYAVTWGAVLLLDEADIFLQDRDYTNLERNALVSIFLRTLEYFNGVLFLTTNRVGAFDQAFQSRIHVTLGLPSLDQQRRISVWSIFLHDLAAKGAITETHHDNLSKLVGEKWSKEKLNGRQIRNTVRTALVLAEKKGAVVGEAEFETVLRIAREFEGYMGMLGKGEGNAGLEGFQEV